MTLQLANTVFLCVLWFNCNADGDLIQTEKPGFNLNLKSGFNVDFTHNFWPGFLNNVSTEVEYRVSMNENKPHIYPRKKVKIIRTAAPFARLIQPDPKKINDAKQFIVTSRNPKVLNVTYMGGILFIQDNRILKDSPEYFSVNISWIRNNRREFEEIQIQVVETADKTCAEVTRLTGWTHCSQYTTRKNCLKSKNCALGTLGTFKWIGNRSRRCMWRTPKYSSKPSDKTTYNNYATCTPDVYTCPDGTCDELEQLHDGICPQDCTNKLVAVNGTAEIINEVTNRGITEANQVCNCDSDECSCDSITVTKLNMTCGTFCTLSIVFGVLFLISAVTVIGIYWGLNRGRKVNHSNHSKDQNFMLTNLKSNRTTPLADTAILNINAVMLPQFSHQSVIKKPRDLHEQVYSKWEFPRNQLTIQKILGEGEFGKVLLARALNIADQSGHTDVAVKTLKEGATESELNDLLSEYNLLKEVCHPNVIRLLGVCTTPDGPVYLITELAEYGSLRNYLRRSRGLTKPKSEMLPTFAVHDGSHGYTGPNIYIVTPKEIVFFASQICNGMVYLSNIRLVHRDLATRNILLTADKICKISDFGLTKDIYEDDVYFKRSRGKVPIKWMAPESISDQIYTSKSDVWSFGVLLWELVTLGVTPYPGITMEKLFDFLCQGYRMKRPDNCSPALYDIMKSCWHIEPEQRPTFQELSKTFEKKKFVEEVECWNMSNNATSEENSTKSREYLSHLQPYVQVANKLNEASNMSKVKVAICNTVNINGYVSR